MRLAKTMIVAALLLSVVGLIWWSATSKAEPIGSELPAARSVASGLALTSPSDTLQKLAMQRLENRLRLLELQAQHPAPKSTVAAIEERNTPRSDTPQLTDAGVAANNLAKAYDVVLRTESVDPQWNAAMRTRFQEFFQSDVAAGSSIRHVECGSTMCRLEIASESKTARETLMQSVAGMSPPNSQGFAHIDTNESLEFVVYVSRENQQLPSLEGNN